LQLISSFLKKYSPTKILELGVAAGGTSAFLLNNLDKKSTLFSVDISVSYHKDRTLTTGHIADRIYDQSIHPRWIKMLGKDISDCLEEIGNEIDFVVLDTVHTLPGEFLSFLSIIPYLQDNSILIIHDIGLQLWCIREKISEKPEWQAFKHWEDRSHCTLLLFNSIMSDKKYLSQAEFPNCGCIVLDKNTVYKNLLLIFYTLFIPWDYMPAENILVSTSNIIKYKYPKEYSETYLKIFEEAILYQRRHFSK
jgi:hypothetical protein